MMANPHFVSRSKKALKIQAILSEHLSHDIDESGICLDLGAGNGRISLVLADLFKRLVALDYDYALVHGALNSTSNAPVFLCQGDGKQLPFSDECMDVVICAQVYEHMANAEELPDEVYRVLKPGGICFFSGPNSVWPVELHYFVPFLHWMPRKIAEFCLRILGKDVTYDIRPFTYWKLKRIWRSFMLFDYTVDMLHNPDKYGLSGWWLGLARSIPEFVFGALYFALPNYNWILVKPNEA